MSKANLIAVSERFISLKALVGQTASSVMIYLYFSVDYLKNQIKGKNRGT